ncbi:MAG: SPFH domain-containing protein [Gammaproteobacteria bacterium]
MAQAKLPNFVVLVVAAIVVAVVIWEFCTKSVPPGHVAVASLFGKVQPISYDEGLHIPVNPLLKWHDYDVRMKTHFETANVPSQDQLQTQLEVSVQYRMIGSQAPLILQNTGRSEEIVQVHLRPALRSLLREQGKSIKRAEDFFLEETQQNLQVALQTGMDEFMLSKGVAVEAVLIRDIQLSQFITKAIEEKKQREQEVEKQKAELERYRTEQQQLVAAATAQRNAAEQTAEKQRILADAQAYEIEKINDAIASNPAYIQLQALESLKAISKDPASKMYFINSDSPMPLPLMHLGEK